MSSDSTPDVTQLMHNVQKNWGLSNPSAAFRKHLQPRNTDKPRDWPLATWQALDQISALVPEYRGYVAFQEKIEKLWQDEERVRVNGVTADDLKDVLVHFQGLVSVSKGYGDRDCGDAEAMTDVKSATQVDEGYDSLRMEMTGDTAESPSYLNRGSPPDSPTPPASESSHRSTSSTHSAGAKRSASDSSDPDTDSEPARKRRQKPRITTAPKSPTEMTKPELIRAIISAWTLDSLHDILTDPKMRPPGPPSKWSVPLLRALCSLALKSTDLSATVATKLKESFDARITERAAENKKEGKKAPSGMRVHVDDVAHAESFIDSLLDDGGSPSPSPSSSGAGPSSPDSESSDASDSSDSSDSDDSAASVAVVVPMATAIQPPRLPPSFVPQKQGLLAHAERSAREARHALVAERADLSAAIQGLGDAISDVAAMDAELMGAYGQLGKDLITVEVREMEGRLRKVLDEMRDRVRLVGLAENRRNACRRDLMDCEGNVVRLRAEEEAAKAVIAEEEVEEEVEKEEDEEDEAKAE